MIEAKAVKIVGKGGPEALTIGTLLVREPRDGEVLVRVYAAGLNRADSLQRRGFYPAPAGVPPDVPGLEFAGEVVEVGSGCIHRVGDRVMGIVSGGAMATHLVAHDDELIRVPDAMTLEQAAAVPEVFMTAYDAVILQGRMQGGERVLIHSVASGVGTAAIQLVKVFGGHCVGTTRSATKVEACESLGLDDAIVVRDGNFSDELLKRHPDGVDVVLDTVGAAYLEQNMQVLRSLGRIVVIGMMGGVKTEINLGTLLAKRGVLMGSVLRSRSHREKAALAASFSELCLPKFNSGELRPVIDEILPAESIAEAHTRMDSNDTIGKIVVTF
ncbi:MAG: NAD(P)H-quinone oxidoreductase [Polyangiales bacterium]